MISDTIAAIATALGEGGIAVVRVSGPDAILAVSGIFSAGSQLKEAQTHTIHYGHVINPKTQERVDEVLVSLMKGPRSFTAEDVVEVHCHGGLIAVKTVLELILLQDVRLAEPGEFTKRAFLNGRIDLSQAEAVMDLIRSKSERAFSLAYKQVEGALSTKIGDLRQQLVELMAHIEVNIDYPEHDVEELTSRFIRDKCITIKEQISQLLQHARQGKILREGIVTAIIGRPNVGKSSLLNALTQEARAIVTDIPGTTRDVIEEYVTVNGVPLRLLDTAGLRETEDIVERIGVERSRQALQDADLILMVVNNNESLIAEDWELMEVIKDKAVILVVNKTDLPRKVEKEAIVARYPQMRIVDMSVLHEQGMDQLEKAISEQFFSGEIESVDMSYVSNSRHIHLLTKSILGLDDALAATEAGIPIDMIQIDVRNVWEWLGEVTGDTAGESLLDQIFSQFCLGK